jgi:hypothetical protein
MGKKRGGMRIFENHLTLTADHIVIKIKKQYRIYAIVIPSIWLVLFIDSAYLAALTGYNTQWISNGLTAIAYLVVYQNTSKVIKKLMLYGILIALGGEVVFSLGFGMYHYRLQNVPLYVPLGHTLVYACVAHLTKEPYIKKHQTIVIRILFTLMIGYCLVFLIFANDLLGFLCMLVILWVFHRRPETKLFSLWMFFIVAYLELLGTYYQCWYWPKLWFDTISWVPSANPPSAISVFYFGFDAGCTWLYKKINPQQWHRIRKIRALRYTTKPSKKPL